MRRPVYILAGFAGIIVGALLLAWEILGTATGLLVPVAPSSVSHSILISSCAVCAASAWFLWRVLGPRK
jgi:hypothetical protein